MIGVDQCAVPGLEQPIAAVADLKDGQMALRIGQDEIVPSQAGHRAKVIDC